MRNKVTIAALAKELGLSQSAVSKALNDYPDISPETKRLVRSKAAELGYSPNAFARNLAKKTSNFVGVVINDMSCVYGEMFKALNMEARRHGLNLILYDTNNDPDTEAECMRSLLDMMPLGIVVAPVDEHIEQIRKMTENRVPVVYLGENIRDDSVNHVRVDGKAGMERALRHLIDKGHRKIVMLCDHEPFVSQNEKVKVYQEWMRRLWQQEQILYSDAQDRNPAEAGYRLGKRLLTSRMEYTAVIAVSDLLAIGAIGALREAGVKVPQQVAVVGHDGINASALPSVGLTTVAQPREKMAETIIDILRRHAQDPASAPEHIVVKPELIIRNSTAMR